jgi:predicted  nucleic acid-binding Zn-ribbon protein
MAGQDDFVKEAKAQLDKWNAEIKKMQAEAEKMTADAQAQFKTQMEAMEAQRQQAMDQLDKMGKANMAAWQDMQSSFQIGVESHGKGHGRRAQALHEGLTVAPCVISRF